MKLQNENFFSGFVLNNNEKRKINYIIS